MLLFSMHVTLKSAGIEQCTIITQPYVLIVTVQYTCVRDSRYYCEVEIISSLNSEISYYDIKKHFKDVLQSLNIISS